jgi:hypothetical protein
MTEYKTTTKHERTGTGTTDFPHSHKKPNGVARFLGGVLTTTAIALATTGLLLYASIQTNLNHMAKIATLEANLHHATQMAAVTSSTGTGGTVTSTAVPNQNTTATTTQPAAATQANVEQQISSVLGQNSTNVIPSGTEIFE